MSTTRTSPFLELAIAPEKINKKIRDHLQIKKDNSLMLKATEPSDNILSSDVSVLIDGKPDSKPPINEDDAVTKLKALFLTSPAKSGSENYVLSSFKNSWNPAYFKDLFTDESLKKYKPEITLNIRRENDDFFVDMHIDFYDTNHVKIDHCDWTFKFEPDEDCFIPRHLVYGSMVLQELLVKEFDVVTITGDEIKEAIKKSASEHLKGLKEFSIVGTDGKETIDLRYVSSRNTSLTAEEKQSKLNFLLVHLERSDVFVFGNPPFDNTPEKSPIFKNSKEYLDYLDEVNRMDTTGNIYAKTKDGFLKEALDKFLMRIFGQDKQLLSRFYETVIPHLDQNSMGGNSFSAILEGTKKLPSVKAIYGEFADIGKDHTKQNDLFNRIFFDGTNFHLQNIVGYINIVDPNEKLNWVKNTLSLQSVTIYSETYFDKTGSHFTPEKITGPRNFAQFTKELYLGTAKDLPSKEEMKEKTLESESLTASTNSTSDASETTTVKKTAMPPLATKAVPTTSTITPTTSPHREPVDEDSKKSIEEILPDNDVLADDVQPQVEPAPKSEDNAFVRWIKDHPYWTALIVFTIVAIVVIAATVATAGVAGLPSGMASGLAASAFASTAVGAAVTSALATAAAASAAVAASVTAGIIAGFAAIGFALIAGAIAIYRRVTSKPPEVPAPIGGGSRAVMHDTLDIKADTSPPTPAHTATGPAETFKTKKISNLAMTEDRDTSNKTKKISKPGAIDPNPTDEDKPESTTTKQF